ncbi:hypothetical protein EMIT093MI4_70209 [Pseudomonas sp. IT-93MI4]
MALRVSSTASRVELAPVPAITGMRPATCLTTALMTAMCSSTSRVADSPVVPTATMAWVPFLRWKSTSLLRLSQSRRPCASMGVTSATILPAIMKPLLPEKESGNGTGAKMLAQAKYCAAIPLGVGFRYPSDFDRYRSACTPGSSLPFRPPRPRSSVAAARSAFIGANCEPRPGAF